jgi:hypothetical protein
VEYGEKEVIMRKQSLEQQNFALNEILMRLDLLKKNNIARCELKMVKRKNNPFCFNYLINKFLIL